MENEMKRKLAAILVADVVGYSRLTADDEEATLRRLEVFRSIWQDCLAKTDGRIFNTAGDAILAEFQSGVEAVRCAIDFQTRAKAQNDGLVTSRQMHFRVGITIGDVVERRGDLLGDGVNIAARLQTLAGPGGICVSSWVREAVANKLGVKFTDLGDQQVKNIPTPIRAYLVGTPDGGTGVPMQNSASAQQQDWLGRAASSWRGTAAVLGLSAAGIFGAFLLISQFRSAPPSSNPTQSAAPAKGDPREMPPGPSSSSKAGSSPPVQKDPHVAKAAAKTAEAAPVQKSALPSSQVAPGPRIDPAIRLGMLSETAERDLKAGDRFRECDSCPEMVVIPRGEFQMGSPDTQPGHEPDETPVRKVSLGARIAVARYATSVGEYEQFVAVSGYRPGAGCRVHEGTNWIDRPELSFRNPGFQQAPDHPVVCVNWNDAKAFTDWMTARMNAQYRLPTEAEREYATRAGTATLFSWGNDIAPGRAAYDWSNTFGQSPRGEPRRGTHAVGAFQPNPWGLFQLHGNVSEWVEDCYGSYRGAPSDGSAQISGSCKLRVLRGGSWGNAPKDLRSAYRENATQTYRNFNFGFRIVRVLRGGR